jgi:hypothetical protein
MAEGRERSSSVAGGSGEFATPDAEEKLADRSAAREFAAAFAVSEAMAASRERLLIFVAVGELPASPLDRF